MQHLRRGVEPVGPDERSQLVIGADLAKVVRVLEWLSEGAAHQKPQSTSRTSPSLSSTRRTRGVTGVTAVTRSTLQMPGQRIDRDQRLKRLRQLPRAVKLLGMQTRPLTDQTQRPTRQLAVQDLKRSKLDLRQMLALLGTKSAAADDRAGTRRSRSHRTQTASAHPSCRRRPGWRRLYGRVTHPNSLTTTPATIRQGYRSLSGAALASRCRSRLMSFDALLASTTTRRPYR